MNDIKILDKLIIFLRANRNLESLMVRQCAWCEKILGFKEGYGNYGITHGICRKCADNQLEKLRAYKYGYKAADYDLYNITSVDCWNKKHIIRKSHTDLMGIGDR